VLDGEIAIYDQQLRSRFEWLRELDPDAVASPSEGRIVRYAQVVVDVHAPTSRESLDRALKIVRRQSERTGLSKLLKPQRGCTHIAARVSVVASSARWPSRRKAALRRERRYEPDFL
jgi:hypothetical protein